MYLEVWSLLFPCLLSCMLGRSLRVKMCMYWYARVGVHVLNVNSHMCVLLGMGHLLGVVGPGLTCALTPLLGWFSLYMRAPLPHLLPVISKSSARGRCGLPARVLLAPAAHFGLPLCCLLSGASHPCMHEMFLLAFGFGARPCVACPLSCLSIELGSFRLLLCAPLFLAPRLARVRLSLARFGE